MKQTRVGVKTTIKDGVIKTMDGLESILDMDSVLAVISSVPSFYPGFSFGVQFQTLLILSFGTFRLGMVTKLQLQFPSSRMV